MTNTSVYSIVLKEVARQGLPFLLLCTGIYYLYGRQIQLHSEIQDCNSSLIEFYQSDHEKMIKVIDQNNKLFTKIIDQ